MPFEGIGTDLTPHYPSASQLLMASKLAGRATIKGPSVAPVCVVDRGARWNPWQVPVMAMSRTLYKLQTELDIEAKGVQRLPPNGAKSLHRCSLGLGLWGRASKRDFKTRYTTVVPRDYLYL